MIFLYIILVILLFWLYFKFFKLPKFGNMTLVTGGIKTGKSMLSVHFAIKTYKKHLRRYKIKCLLLNLGKKLKIKKALNTANIEKPLLYSNIPLTCEYVPITRELLTREHRPNYKSVFYICEASLVADSMTYKDDLLNEQLLLFNKLFAHATRGGYIFYDTQSISDNHYAVKRCLSSYFYIHHMKKLPFFCVMYLREMTFSEDNNAVNVFETDVEETLKRVIVSKRVWKKYDCYCYSALTDNNFVESTLTKASNLKAENIVSFKKYKTLMEVANNDKK